jgi:hypothetical protein
MDWMDRHILRCPLQAILFLLLFASCGSHKSSVKTRSEDKNVLSVLTSESYSENTQGNTRIEESCDETVTTVRVEYDTSRPVLSSTGKPPVKSEETTIRQHGTKRNTEESLETVITDIGEALIDKDEQSKKSDDTKEKYSNVRSSNIIWLISGLICLVIVFRLVKRKPP